MLLILQSIKVFVCPILRSHGNRQPHFMNFKFIGDVKSGIVPELGIDSSRHPAPLLASSREKRGSN